ncbi:hypothetical protein H6P81_021738 [Aristolochia fimbriata]|uniref:Uncharacterized protein n=1 Tax=Aristolochia fimbriata TaxID=158543 RepID=A0AAV7DTN9_ARIFI|nr:hypothetical protein H6P81_021738 [Aristolochia fimbriata]
MPALDCLSNFKSYEGSYFFLWTYFVLQIGSDIHFMYIEGAAKTGQIKDVKSVERRELVETRRIAAYILRRPLVLYLPMVFLWLLEKGEEILEILGRSYPLPCMPTICFDILKDMAKKRIRNAPLVVVQLLDDECPEDFVKVLLYLSVLSFRGSSCGAILDLDIHFMYIEGAAKTGQIKDVKSVNPGNAPLVVVQLCDDECPEDFIKVLLYLSVLSFQMILLFSNVRRGYGQKVNPRKAPLVVVQLCDDECAEDFIKVLLYLSVLSFQMIVLLSNVRRERELVEARQLLYIFAKATGIVSAYGFPVVVGERAAKEYPQPLGVDACIRLFEQFKSYEGWYFFLGTYLSSRSYPLPCMPTICFDILKDMAKKLRDAGLLETRSTRSALYIAKATDVVSAYGFPVVVGERAAKEYPQPLGLMPALDCLSNLNLMRDCTSSLGIFELQIGSDIHFKHTEGVAKTGQINYILPTTMYANNRYIEGYDQNVNPGNAPLVVVQLLDDECPEDFIKGLTLSVRSLLQRIFFLEQYEESQDVFVHISLGKIIGDSNNNPEHFLQPILTMTLGGGYVVERMDPELWEKILSPDNEFRRQLIDQVVSTSLPESKSPEQVSAAVKAIKADPSRVMVINRQPSKYWRAVEFAFWVAEYVVWSQVAKVQLCEGLVSDAIESFIRAEDATQFLDDIWASEDANVYHDLVSLPNVGDRLCDEASKVIYAFISNWAKLAVTLVKRKQFQGAVDAARKANRSKTWKEVCFACGDAEEFRLAQIFRLSIIVQVDELEEVSDYYQNRGCFNELISFMESGLVLERAHMAIFYRVGSFVCKISP